MKKQLQRAVSIMSMLLGLAVETKAMADGALKIIVLEPPQKDFFSKELFYENIPIKAPSVVVDKAL